MRKWLLVFCAGLMMLAAGCMNFKYKGESFKKTTDIKLYEKASKVPQKYIVMGRCVCTGRYSKFTQEEMFKKILREAEDYGADAVLIYAYQIVPTGMAEARLLGEDGVTVWAEGSGEVTNWNQLTRDFDGKYGTIGKKNNKDVVPHSYSRIVRAKFLKFRKNLPADYQPKVVQTPPTIGRKDPKNTSIAKKIPRAVKE